MLRLLPSVCRDCGASSEESTLSRYLDFLLCSRCIGLREKALREIDARRPAARRVDDEAPRPADEIHPPVAPGKKKRPPRPAPPRKTARKAAKKSAPTSARESADKAASKPARKAPVAKKPKPPRPKR